MLSIEQIKAALRAEDLAVLKQLGQNFLIDETVLGDIVAAAELEPAETVMEVGPGLGVLTFALAERGAQVLAVEKDRKLAKRLRAEAAGKALPVEVLGGDILRANLPQLLAERRIGRYKVVANIPYYITSAIIKLFLEAPLPPQAMVLLVQREVAERICAPKGELSVLALSVRLYGEPALVRLVGSTSFYPAPKVDSAVLRIDRIGRRYSGEEYRALFGLIKMGFASRRKTLVNNLAAGLRRPKDELVRMLETGGLDPRSRAQDLGVEDWVKLLALVEK